MQIPKIIQNLFKQSKSLNQLTKLAQNQVKPLQEYQGLKSIGSKQSKQFTNQMMWHFCAGVKINNGFLQYETWSMSSKIFLENEKDIGVHHIKTGNVSIHKIEKSATKGLHEVTFRFNIDNELILTNLVLPAPQVNSNIEDIEKACISWAEQTGIYPKKLIPLLKATWVGGLVGVCYPESFGKEKLLKITQWLCTLFAMDDWLDVKKETRELTTLQEENRRKEEVLRDRLPLCPNDSIRTLVMHQLFLATPEFQQDPTFLKSFFDYCKSTETELGYKANKLLPGEESERIRMWTSGADHSLRLGCSMVGINSEELLTQYFTLRSMLECVSQCVAFSNDLFSFAKEKGDTYNLSTVQVDLNEGKSTKEAFLNTTKKHNDASRSFFKLKSILMTEIEKIQKGEREKIDTMISIMEGWLAHPFWANEAPRYTLSKNPPLYANLRVLQDMLQKDKP